MINILIKDSDVLYRHGMMQYLTEILSKHSDKQLHFTQEFNRDTVRQADIIVLELCKGENYTCIPELSSRKQGIIFGLVDDAFDKIAPGTQCIEDIVFIRRSAPLNDIGRTILKLWSKHNQPATKMHCSNCFSCRHRRMSRQQTRIMARYFHGRTIPEIAKELRINDKTIYSHKYVVMNKFNLASDYELLIFLNKLKESTIVPNTFREHLDHKMLPGFAVGVEC